jgi:hypothetical protein
MKRAPSITRFDVEFWRNLLAVDPEDPAHLASCVRKMIVHRRWDAIDAAIAAGVPMSRVGGQCLTQFGYELDTSADDNAAPHPSWLAASPRIDAWIAAMKGKVGGKLKVQAAGALMNSYLNASMEIVRRLTVSGMDYQAVLLGPVGTKIYNDLQRPGSSGASLVPRHLAALLPQHMDELPQICVHGEGRKMVRTDLASSIAYGPGCFSAVAGLYRLLLERCPSKAAQWSREMRAVLDGRDHHELGISEQSILLPACKLVAGVEPDEATKKAMLSRTYKVRDRYARYVWEGDFLTSVLSHLADESGAKLARRWVELGLPLQIEEDKQNKYCASALLVSLGNDMPMTTWSLIEGGADPNASCRPTSKGRPPNSVLEELAALDKAYAGWGETLAKARAITARRAAERAIAAQQALSCTATGARSGLAS